MIIINKLFEAIINYALDNQCSDIHLDYNSKDECELAIRLFGKMYNLQTLNSNSSNKLFNYILFKANLDIVNKQTLHTGIINYKYHNKIYSLRVSVVFASMTRSLVIRILNNHQNITIDNLSRIDENKNNLQEILSYRNGLVVFTGKTGSGKTTTMYALLEELKKNNKIKIITLEDPIERQIEGILQVAVNNEIITYFDVLKQVLRHDPDIIVIGEIRDEKDLKLAIQAALSGHLVITSMHAINAKFAINRLLELKLSHSDLKACLRLISYQELLYDKQKQPFSIYEFVSNEQLIKYLDTDELEYNDINYYKSRLSHEEQYYEGK